MTDNPQNIKISIICPDGVIRMGTPEQLVKTIEHNLNKQQKKWWQIWKT